MVILASTRVKDALEKYPQLKEVLISLSPKFKKLNNSLIFKAVARWATFADVAKIGGLSLCEVLHRLNREVGTEEELAKHAPDCLREVVGKTLPEGEKPDWVKEAKQIVVMDVRDRDDFFFPEILRSLRSLERDQILKVVNDFYPAPLINMLQEEGYSFHYENPSFNTHILYVNPKEEGEEKNWLERKEEFEVLDVRGWREDPFSAIIKKANETPPGEGFRIIQYFLPTPLINMIEPLGFEVHIEKRGPLEHHVYFYKKKEVKRERKKTLSGRVPLVIQSATPVVYPIIMRLLQSKRLMDLIKIEELKIWDKTEKHLGWIINGRADISFSAVAAVAKLYQKGLDIKMKAVVVWDNFFILTRGFEARDFGDLRGKPIHLPLIKAAPPYAVTTFLMKALGYDPEEFEFAFGNPFGRPADIKEMLVKGEAEVGLLREPEASFAIFEGKGQVKEAIRYADLWEKLFPGKGNLPNAGILFKGEVLREYPEVSRIFLEEAEKAIDWVVKNPSQAARLSYEIMGIVPEEAELFLKRVTFKYAPSERVIDHITHYIDVLNKAGYGGKPFGELRDLFLEEEKTGEKQN